MDILANQQRRGRRALRIAAAAIAVSATCACGGTHGSPAESAHDAVVLGRHGEAKSVAYAPVGSEFEVRLDQAIDTRTSRPGQDFLATVAQPIVSSGGTVLVPAGTKIHGKIAQIDETAPRIDLAFESLELPGGPVPVGARVVSAEQSRYRAVPATSGVANAQPGSGPGPALDSGATQISMPQGGVVRLALTRPIVDGRSL